MKHTDYYKSGEQLKNIEQARILAELKNKELKTKRIKEYYSNPKICKNKNCDNPIEYAKKRNDFCSKTCSASHNNTGRVCSSEQKIKQSLALKGKKFPGRGNGGGGQNICNVCFKTCSVCNKLFTAKGKDNKRVKKTCSIECQTIAKTANRTYQNGSRKSISYFNPYQNKDVILESSWEVKVADFLCKKDIHWIRPSPIKWIDSNNDAHMYYPDFYLPDYSLYLDPKNEYCMQLDQEKLSVVTKSINLKYGDINYILAIIDNLV